MKEVIFSEEQLNDLDAIAAELFNNEHDPQSAGYVRKLNRPKINLFKIALCILIPLLISTALVFLLKHFGLSTAMALIIAAIFLTLYIILTLKRSIICAVKIYQRYAPDSLRNRCRFEPSCSEYMILAITKYGLIKGLKKGIHRLKRCNIDNGGFDYP